ECVLRPGSGQKDATRALYVELRIVIQDRLERRRSEFYLGWYLTWVSERMMVCKGVRKIGGIVLREVSGSQENKLCGPKRDMSKVHRSRFRLIFAQRGL